MSSEGTRLHPAAIGVLALGALRDAAVPIVVLLVASLAGRGLDTEALVRGAIYLVLGVAIASLTGFVRWMSTSYAVDDRGVHWRSGGLSKKSTTVPLGRIQGLDTVAGPVQRLFGVVAVHVQSAGGGAKGEIVLDAVGPAAGGGVRGGVGAGGGGRGGGGGSGAGGGGARRGAAARPPAREQRRERRLDR